HHLAAASQTTSHLAAIARVCCRALANPRASSRPLAVDALPYRSTSFRTRRPEPTSSGHKPCSQGSTEPAPISTVPHSRVPIRPALLLAPRPALPLASPLFLLSRLWLPPRQEGQLPIVSPAPGMQFRAKIESRGCLLRDRKFL